MNFSSLTRCRLEFTLVYSIIINIKRKTRCCKVSLIKALSLRICELCREKNITPYALAIKADMPPSTLNSILENKSKNPRISSIKKICTGFDITLSEFYHSKLFENAKSDVR